MKFDDMLERLDSQTRVRLAKGALYFPRIARGHGSLRVNECNAVGCRMSDNHTQERIELAYKAMYE